MKNTSYKIKIVERGTGGSKTINKRFDAFEILHHGVRFLLQILKLTLELEDVGANDGSKAFLKIIQKSFGSGVAHSVRKNKVK